MGSSKKEENQKKEKSKAGSNRKGARGGDDEGSSDSDQHLSGSSSSVNSVAAGDDEAPQPIDTIAVEANEALLGTAAPLQLNDFLSKPWRVGLWLIGGDGRATAASRFRWWFCSLTLVSAGGMLLMLMGIGSFYSAAVLRRDWYRDQWLESISLNPGVPELVYAATLLVVNITAFPLSTSWTFHSRVRVGDFPASVAAFLDKDLLKAKALSNIHFNLVIAILYQAVHASSLALYLHNIGMSESPGYLPVVIILSLFVLGAGVLWTVFNSGFLVVGPLVSTAFKTVAAKISNVLEYMERLNVGATPQLAFMGAYTIVMPTFALAVFLFANGHWYFALYDAIMLLYMFAYLFSYVGINYSKIKLRESVARRALVIRKSQHQDGKEWTEAELMLADQLIEASQDSTVRIAGSAVTTVAVFRLFYAAIFLHIALLNNSGLSLRAVLGYRA